jgi:hypothetical protein
MGLGPIEVLEIGFPGNEFNGEILPELERLVESNTISIIDGLFLQKGDDGEVAFFELEDVGADESVAHTGAKPLRDAIVGSGGVLAANFRVPGMVVDELLDELAAVE